MTRKLYDQDSHLQEFDAEVVACAPTEGQYLIELDRTAFFPEGGGQRADTGFIGGTRVLDAQLCGDTILHKAESPVEVGKTVRCAIDWQQRFRRMQNHSGEHIVSGIVHNLFGYENVGFHMGADCMTVDFNGVLSGEDLRKTELLANRTLTENRRIDCSYPDSEALQTMTYRSKRAITGNVRIVSIDGVDRCACCAPHVSHTGEIGLIKFLDAVHFHGGTRLRLLCGLDAYEDCIRKYDSVSAVSAALSVKPDEIGDAVQKLLADYGEAKRKAAAGEKQVADWILSSAQRTEGNLCLFAPPLGAVALRELANGGTALCGAICGVFSAGADGGYTYIISSHSVNLQAEIKRINAALQGRGGGRPEMIQGTAKASETVIRAFFDDFIPRAENPGQESL